MLLQKFTQNQSAQVAVLFSIVLFPICAVAGFCFDFQTTQQRIIKLQATLDAAVLAGARAKQSGATQVDTQTAVADFISPQIIRLPGLTCGTPTVTVSTADDEIRAEIECSQKTTLMNLVGQSEVPLKIVSVAHYTVGHLDVAFVFDASNSMRGTRMGDLREAATEAIDKILPEDALPEVIANTRVAMASYSSMLNAGPFFTQVTGAQPTRTYYHTTERDMTDQDAVPGSIFDEMHIGLYDADTSDHIAEIGDNAVIKVRQNQLDNMTIAVTTTSAHALHADVESMRLNLTGEETKDKKESVPPYALYGDSGIDDLEGESWGTGEYKLRVRAYDGNNALGVKLFDEELKFELFKDGDVRTNSTSFTLTSTCVWGRDGTEKFTNAPPGPGAYLAYQQAWYREYPQSNSGEWKIGFNHDGRRRERGGDTCRTKPPVELTNDRDALIDYVSNLSTDAYTAGHLGVAWSWYLISDRWSSIFDGPATPAALDAPDITKAVILMTDGGFNLFGFSGQGTSSEQAKAMCDNMKLEGIDIYSVAFQAPASGREVLEYCASAPGFYFDAQNANQLKQAYREIALSLSDLRIAR